MKLSSNLLTINLILLLCLLLPAGLTAQQDQRLKMALSLEKSGSYQAALDLYLQLHQQQSTSPVIINGIKKTYRELGRFDEMAAFFENLSRKFPGRYDYKINLASAVYQGGDKEKALQIWQSVYEAEPSDATRYRMVGMSLIELRLLDEAIAVYQQAIKKIKGQELLYRDIATLCRAQLDYENAVTNYLNYYRRFNKQFNYIRSQIISLTKDDEAVDRIIGTLQAYLVTNRNDAPVREILASMFIKKKNYQQAFTIYLDLHKINPKKNYLQRFAGEAEANRAFDFAIQAYETILQKKMDDTARSLPLYNLARNYYSLGLKTAALGQAEQAQQHVRQALSNIDQFIGSGANSPTRLNSLELKADIYRDFYNDQDRAIKLYQQLLTKTRDARQKDRVHIKTGDTYLLKNDLQKSRQSYRAVRNKTVKKMADYKLAELTFFSGRFSAARQKYEKLLGSVSLKDSLTNNVLDRLMLIGEFQADSALLARYAGAELLERQQKQSEAAEKFFELAGINKPIRLLAAERAAKLFIRLQELGRARDFLEPFIEENSTDPAIDRLYFLIAEIYSRENQYEQALAAYRKILLQFPDSFFGDQSREKARALSVIIEESKLP